MVAPEGLLDPAGAATGIAGATGAAAEDGDDLGCRCGRVCELDPALDAAEDDPDPEDDA